MKKILGVFILLLVSSSLWAQSHWWEPDFSGGLRWKTWEKETVEEAPPPPPEKEKFRFNNRMIELSVANVSVGFSNDFISAADILKNPFEIVRDFGDILGDFGNIYQDPVSVDLDDFFKGFNLTFGATIKPFSLNYNWKDKWGFGLDIAHIKATGDLSLAANMLTLKEVEEEKSHVGVAVFADVGIPVFFHIKKLKLKLRPAAYAPLFYADSQVTYTGKDKTHFEVNYDMRVYSIANTKGFEGAFDEGIDMDLVTQDMQDDYMGILTNNMGYDLGLGVEYPVARWLDIGVDFVNIPIVKARLNHYLRLQGTAYLDTDIDFNEIIEKKGEFPDGFWEKVYNYETEDPVAGYDSDGKAVPRPFATLFYVNYHPFRSRILSLIPSVGFSYNSLYLEPFHIEGGLNTRIDLANIFVTTLGVNYNDRMWKNSIDFILNLRVFELDFGLASHSPDFVKSWQGAGVNVNVGVKFGF
jgi:hypothetical protein